MLYHARARLSIPTGVARALHGGRFRGEARAGGVEPRGGRPRDARGIGWRCPSGRRAVLRPPPRPRHAVRAELIGPWSPRNVLRLFGTDTTPSTLHPIHLHTHRDNAMAFFGFLFREHLGTDVRPSYHTNPYATRSQTQRWGGGLGVGFAGSAPFPAMGTPSGRGWSARGGRGGRGGGGGRGGRGQFG